MNIPARIPLFGATLALLLALFSGLTAEENAPRTPQNEATVAPEAPETALPPAEEDSPPLRRLDVVPSEEPSRPEESSAQSAAVQEAAPSSESAGSDHGQQMQWGGHGGSARVSFWQNSELAEGEKADAVVSIFGSSTSAGRVDDAVVSVFGSSTSSGRVGSAVVSVFGSSRVTGGEVRDGVVSVIGNTYVNGIVRGEVVAVFGNVELGPDAVVHGDVACVGGSVRRHADAVVHGEVNHIAVGGEFFSGFEGIHAWISQCLKKARPLAFGPDLMWAWWIAIGFLALYILMAALFSRAVNRCAETLEQHTGYSLLTAVLALILAPIAAVLLLPTIVGTPALVMGLFVMTLFGKAVMLAWIGRRITQPFGGGRFAPPALAVLIGGVIVLGLYTVPIVGFVTAKLVSWLGLGVVIYTMIVGMKRNRVPVAPAASNVPSPAAVPPMGIVPPPIVVPAFAVPPEAPPVPNAVPPQNPQSAGFTGAAATSAATAMPASVPLVISAATLQRAGFWIRLAASLLDALLVGVTINLLPNLIQPNFFLAIAVYCIVLWGLKGTTIGGIVCNLKIVRLDDRPVDWPTALVRGLAGFLSFVAAGIGFIWVAFDLQRQSWHDKIAGTTIVHVPKGVPLV